jgi:hypothetical protein
MMTDHFLESIGLMFSPIRRPGTVRQNTTKYGKAEPKSLRREPM